MGYDVHITRKDDWSDTEGDAISREEWLDFVGGDKSLALSGEAVVSNDQGQEIRITDETLTLWKDWPKRENGKTEALMWYSAGNVMATNPDDLMLRKMFLIADALGAKLQGDDGETYNSIGMVDRRDRSKKQWWKFW
ncbi:MAG: hypothetical protein KJN60_11250 [Boseongicola sp.]|nr:hypothetical protein [Boseongicola sp.]